MKHLGISAEKLDEITVYLRWGTAKKLSACWEALEYWEALYKKKPLEVCDANIAEFETSFLGCAAWNERLNRWRGFGVHLWVTELSGGSPWRPSRGNTAVTRELKAVLLRNFQPEIFKSLGGKEWHAPTKESRAPRSI